MSERRPCLVPFCRRTRTSPADDDLEWICPDHWRLVGKAMRRVYQRAVRADRTRRSPRARRLWRRCRSAAIEAAGGIA